jgi:hypothetical protein
MEKQRALIKLFLKIAFFDRFKWMCWWNLLRIPPRSCFIRIGLPAVITNANENSGVGHHGMG